MGSFKELGNAAYRESNFEEAVKQYSAAIDEDPFDHTLYSNRSAAYQQLGDYKNAARDASKTIQLDPEFVKGYARKGQAEFFLGNFGAAMEAYEQGLVLDPENGVCKSGLERCQQRLVGTGAQKPSVPAANRGATRDSELRKRPKKTEVEPEEDSAGAPAEGTKKKKDLRSYLSRMVNPLGLRPLWWFVYVVVVSCGIFGFLEFRSGGRLSQSIMGHPAAVRRAAGGKAEPPRSGQSKQQVRV
mmetsp:Transcript_12437/g.31017  ORF Transcript_12437/g.31017 Transcript_12437/m.31017 type:complete len:243 (+) Transcript_12437:39-767(+)